MNKKTALPARCFRDQPRADPRRLRSHASGTAARADSTTRCADPAAGRTDSSRRTDQPPPHRQQLPTAAPTEAGPCLIIGALYGGPITDAGYNQAMHEAVMAIKRTSIASRSSKPRTCPMKPARPRRWRT